MAWLLVVERLVVEVMVGSIIMQDNGWNFARNDDSELCDGEDRGKVNVLVGELDICVPAHCGFRSLLPASCVCV